jgi:hypothetical protein
MWILLTKLQNKLIAKVHYLDKILHMTLHHIPMMMKSKLYDDRNVV